MTALTREVTQAITRCELTHLARAPIDLARARAQHAAYEACLAEAGCRVTRLTAAADMPDSVFIEDIAIVFPELAVITRPGTPARRGETTGVAEALRPHRRLLQIEAPGTMDGGDVLVIGRRVFVGISSRTNTAAASQLRALLAPHSYLVEEIKVCSCLHLKSAATCIGENSLLMNPAWLPTGSFAEFDRVEIDPREPMAANAVLAGNHVIFPNTFPHTLERLRQRGLRLLPVDASELAKAEGALTCCSLIFDPQPMRP